MLVRSLTSRASRSMIARFLFLCKMAREFLWAPPGVSRVFFCPRRRPGALRSRFYPLLKPLGRLLERSGTDFSSKGKPGYHGTGSAFSERAASIASGQQQSRKASRKRSRQALRSRQASRARSAPPLSVLEGCRLERLSRGRAQRIASSRAKWNENGLKMLPRGLPNRSKIAPRWLPGGSRAPPESANESGHLFCSFFSSLGRLLGCSWGAPGGSWGGLGASWAAPGPPAGWTTKSLVP